MKRLSEGLGLQRGDQPTSVQWQLKGDEFIFAEARDGLELQLERLKADIRKRYIHQEGSAALEQVIHGAARIYNCGSFQGFLNINMTDLICCSHSPVSTRRLQ